MDNPSRSVCLIENAIDRLIEYGDRIHAAYRKQHPDLARQKVLQSSNTKISSLGAWVHDLSRKIYCEGESVLEKEEACQYRITMTP
ncbi:hypothetical protein Aduo_014956 [Ancylostoma duodenale]